MKNLWQDIKSVWMLPILGKGTLNSPSVFVPRYLEMTQREQDGVGRVRLTGPARTQSDPVIRRSLMYRMDLEVWEARLKAGVCSFGKEVIGDRRSG